MARANIQKDNYPAPEKTLEKEIAEKRAEQVRFHNKAADRPTNPAEARALHDRIENELAELIAQNEQIIQNNNAAREFIDQRYQSEIEAFKADLVNVQMATDEVARKKIESEAKDMEFERDRKKFDLERDFIAALILNDTAAMEEIRIRYHALI
jgi:hypothetical protein